MQYIIIGRRMAIWLMGGKSSREKRKKEKIV